MFDFIVNWIMAESRCLLLACHASGVKTKFAERGISIGNYTVREALMKIRTRVWQSVYNTAST